MQSRCSKGKDHGIKSQGIARAGVGKVVPDPDGATILPLAKIWIKKGSIMVTDEWRSIMYYMKIIGPYVNGCF